MNWLVVAITGLALAVRVVTASWTGFTSDEANGVAIALSGSWAQVVKHLKEDGNAPLFYLFSWIVGPLTGEAYHLWKALAVALSTAVVPVSYLICRRFLKPALACQVALMLALCPTVVRYGTLVRGYTLIPLLSLLSMWSFERLLARPGSGRCIAAYGASTALLVYCHYWGAFVAVGQAAALVVALSVRRLRWQQLKGFAAGAGLAVLLFAPWLPVVYYQATHVLSPWDRPAALSTLLSTLSSYLLVGAGYTLSPIDQLSLFLSTALVVIALASPRALVWQPATPGEASRGSAGILRAQTSEPGERTHPACPDEVTQGEASRGSAGILRAQTSEPGERTHPACPDEDRPLQRSSDTKPPPDGFDERLWKLVLLLGLAVAMTISYLKPVLRERYLSPFAPILMVVYVAAAAALMPRLAASRAYILPVLVWLPLWIPQYLHMCALPESGTAVISARIARESDRQGDLVVISCQCMAPAVNIYLPKDIAVVNFPDLDRCVINRWDGMDERLRNSANLQRIFKEADRALRRGGAVWLVEPARTFSARDPEDDSPVRLLSFLELDCFRMDQIRTWLTMHAVQDGLTELAPGRDVNVMLSAWRSPAVSGEQGKRGSR